MSKTRNGFTALENALMVVFVGGIIAAAVYISLGMTENSRVIDCQANVRRIDQALEAWRRERPGWEPTMFDLVNKQLGTMPKCPSGGHYTFDSVSACSIHGPLKG